MYQLLTIIGRLGKDPEMRYTPGGVPMCKFSVATDKHWTNDQGQKQEETTWHNVTVWRKQAESCAQYLTKGSLVLVAGSVKASGYTNRDGAAAASLEITAENVKFLSTRADAAQAATTSPTAAPGEAGGAPIAEEEIPF